MILKLKSHLKDVPQSIIENRLWSHQTITIFFNYPISFYMDNMFNMKKQHILYSLFLCFPFVVQAKTPLLKSNTIQAKAISGVYPTLTRPEYQHINQTIKHFIYQDLAKRAKILDHSTGFDAITVDYQLISHHKQILNFAIQYEINDMTSRYFKKYYSIDLKNKKILTLNHYLSSKKISTQRLNQALNQFIMPCRKRKTPDYCHDIGLAHLLQQYNKLDIRYHDSFYILNQDQISITFHSTKWSTDFIFNLKNAHVDLN